MALSDFLLGSSGQFQQAPRFTAEQQSVLNNLLAQGAGASSFAPIEQQARTQFQTQTVPSIAERFTAMGGGQRSSAFQGALGQAASGLEQNLAALKSQHGLQQLQFGLTPQFENAYQPGNTGLLGTLGQGAATIAPMAAAAYGMPGLSQLLMLLNLLGGQSNQSGYNSLGQRLGGF